MSASTVGLYVRTTILTTIYDRYEAEMLSFCEREGWDNVLIYRDRVGGKVAQSGFDAFERALKQGKVDEDALGQIVRQGMEDEEHNRDGFRQLVGDASSGKIDTILIHDVGQLGQKRMEILTAIAALLDTRKKVFILGIGHIKDDTDLFPSPEIDCPDAFGMSSPGTGRF